jgi:hypothetical protein
MNETTDTSRRGTWLIVRCFGDEAKRVRLWEENENAVWVVSDERYKRGIAGYDIVGPYVGFRWDAVFEDDPEWVDAWEPSTEAFWEGLTPFRKVRSDA